MASAFGVGRNGRKDGDGMLRSCHDNAWFDSSFSDFCLSLHVLSCAALCWVALWYFALVSLGGGIVGLRRMEVVKLSAVRDADV